MRNFIKILFAIIIVFSLGQIQDVNAASDSIVIYEAYGGGGNSGAIDYVVLKNISNKEQSLDGLYLHRGSINAWQDKIKLSGNLKPGQCYVIEASKGSNFNAKGLPKVDIKAPSMRIPAKSFSIALTKDYNKPSKDNIIDLLGTGGSQFYENKPSIELDNYHSIRRINDTDTDNNANDFKDISLYESSLDYLKKTTESSDSTVIIDLNGGEINEAYRNREGLVIYEAYGYGGGIRSIYANDYIVLKNNSDETINLEGDYLHFGGYIGWDNDTYALKGSIAANGYFIIKGKSSTGVQPIQGDGRDLPRVDMSIFKDFGWRDLSVAITKDRENPNKKNTIDLLGVGDTKYSEGNKATNPSFAIRQSLRRINDGQDTDDNDTDFALIDHIEKSTENLPLDYINYAPVNQEAETYKILIERYFQGQVADDNYNISVKKGESTTIPTMDTADMYINQLKFEYYNVLYGTLKDENGNIVKTISRFDVDNKKFIPESDITLGNPRFTPVESHTLKIDLNDESKITSKEYKDFQRVVIDRPADKENSKFLSYKVEGKLLDKDGNEVNEQYLKPSDQDYYYLNSDVILTSQWENIKPETKTVKFVVDPKKATVTGAMSVVVSEGENPLDKAPTIEVKEGYRFVEWRSSEDGLTYTAIFEENSKPTELIRDRSIKFELMEAFDGDKIINVQTSQAGDVVVIEVNGKEILRKASTKTSGYEDYELSENLQVNDKFSVYIIRNNKYKSSKINKIISE